MVHGPWSAGLGEGRGAQTMDHGPWTIELQAILHKSMVHGPRSAGWGGGADHGPWTVDHRTLSNS